MKTHYMWSLLLAATLTAAGCTFGLPTTWDPAPASVGRFEALDGTVWNSRAGVITRNRAILRELAEGRK